jgi:hypothetical protein
VSAADEEEAALSPSVDSIFDWKIEPGPAIPVASPS